MKTTQAFVIGLLVLLLAACNQLFRGDHYSGNKPVIAKDSCSAVNDSIEVVSECSSESFTSVLEEDTTKYSNAFTLTIKSSDGAIIKTSTLDVRPRMSHINYCNDYYTVVGFPCGGPCYSQVFVFTLNDRSEEQYEYCQRISNNPGLIAYIKNEEFENLIVHNFDNSKEIVVDISDNNWLNFGQMDSLYMIQNELMMMYTDTGKIARTKSANLDAILK